MKTSNLFLALAATCLLLTAGRNNAVAQPNFDPQQMQQMIEQAQQRAVDDIRDQLAVTNDAEWNVLQPQISKLIKKRTDLAMNGSGAMGMMRMMMGNRGNFPGFGTPDPDQVAVQQAIDNDAPPKQIRAALERYRAACQRKADDLAKDEEQLRKSLTPRQEAVLSIAGVLDSTN